MKKQISIFWFRRDLRLEDNHGLYLALKYGLPVVPIFIFDPNILGKLKNPSDPRVQFIHQTIIDLDKRLKEFQSGLKVYHGIPEDIFNLILNEHDVANVFFNNDYEPYAIIRDKKINSLCSNKGVHVVSVKDHVIFEGNEILKSDGKPYTVFTPYSKKWKASFHPINYPSEKYLEHFSKIESAPILPLSAIGFEKSSIPIPSKEVVKSIIRNYESTRNFPGMEGTSKLGIHFRFGTISIREKAQKALAISTTFLNELIWRDFYSMILFHFPEVTKNAFKKPYDFIKWRNLEEEFDIWKRGLTGYPMVDAGMRELAKTGYMHNRLRMITASFLTKHLLIDWRWGEAYFAENLLDFDLASNNGGWQWASGSGTDAAPYFRIFNPTSQQEKFDVDYTYIKKWIPEWGSTSYPKPIVDHKMARDRCLRVYKEGLEKGKNQV
jgi:deoxyribodipyrimidine photo-lyase